MRVPRAMPAAPVAPPDTTRPGFDPRTLFARLVGASFLLTHDTGPPGRWPKQFGPGLPNLTEPSQVKQSQSQSQMARRKALWTLVAQRGMTTRFAASRPELPSPALWAATAVDAPHPRRVPPFFFFKQVAAAGPPRGSLAFQREGLTARGSGSPAAPGALCHCRQLHRWTTHPAQPGVRPTGGST